VNERRSGVPCPKITIDTIEKCKEHRVPSITERVKGILQYLYAKTERLGDPVSFLLLNYQNIYNNTESSDVPDSFKTYLELLAHSGSEKSSDLCFLLNYLQKHEYVELSVKNNSEQTCIMTVEGYHRFEEMKSPIPNSSKAFVAMWFDESMHNCLGYSD